MFILKQLIATASRGVKEISQICTYSSSCRNIRKSVFISQSTDMFSNLALEHWFSRKYDFSRHHVLLLWQNDPCVVLGHHQNPWLEPNIPKADTWCLPLVRPKSSNNSMYNDHGILNLAFFAPHDQYNRMYNLGIVQNTLYDNWRLTSMINDREDIVVKNNKALHIVTHKWCRPNINESVFNTAANLEQPFGSHYCSLFVNVDNIYMKAVREKKETGIEKDTSPVMNLYDINHNIRMNNLLTAIGWEYLSTKPFHLYNEKYDEYDQIREFQFVNPTEGWFFGINEFIDKVRSRVWNLSGAPTFTVTRTFDVPTQDGKTYRVILNLDVESGIVEKIRISLPTEFASSFKQDAINNLCGTKYNREVIENVIAAMGGKTVQIDTREKTVDKVVKLRTLVY